MKHETGILGIKPDSSLVLAAWREEPQAATFNLACVTSACYTTTIYVMLEATTFVCSKNDPSGWIRQLNATDFRQYIWN